MIWDYGKILFVPNTMKLWKNWVVTNYLYLLAVNNIFNTKSQMRTLQYWRLHSRLQPELLYRQTLIVHRLALSHQQSLWPCPQSWQHFECTDSTPRLHLLEPMIKIKYNSNQSYIINKQNRDHKNVRYLKQNLINKVIRFYPCRRIFQ